MAKKEKTAPEPPPTQVPDKVHEHKSDRGVIEHYVFENPKVL